MKLKVKFILWPSLVIIAFLLGSEWWNSHPKIVIPPPISPKSKLEKVDSVLIHTLNENMLSGLGVAIIQDSKLVYEKSIGYINLAEKDSLKNNSLLPVASLSKMFVSLAFAKYLDSVGINPKDPISILNLPEISPQSELGKLSFEKLLRHQSGIKEPGLFNRILRRNSAYTLSDFGEELVSEKRKLESNPQYQYSDTNFDLLGFLFEKTTQKDFQSLLQNNIFSRLGMKQSHFNQKGQIDQGHRKTRVWKRIKKQPMRFPIIPSPSSGLISSLDDLSKGVIQLTRGNLGLMEKELKWLKTSPDLPPAGFQSILIGKQTMTGHFGAQDGVSSLVVFDTNQKFGIVILSNTREINDYRIKLANQIYSIIHVNP